MTLATPPSIRPARVTRRGFLKAGLFGAAGLALYSAEIERHWIDVTHHDVRLFGLPAAFNGMRIVQISDIHLDNLTEPFFLRLVVDRINSLKPDAIFLTGDFITAFVGPARSPVKYALHAAWQCSNILAELECKSLYAVLGNHDLCINAKEVADALTANGITVLRNSWVPIERSGSRFWLAGLDDHPNLDLAIPALIRNVPNEPLVLLCHAPDYADRIMAHPAGRSVDLMLSGHTHGGQVRLPFVGAMVLPAMGRKYIDGWFQFGRMQLYVNRGTVGLPFRFDCPPEITTFTLHTAEALPQQTSALAPSI
jgi:predicted MPP superfamily phosphohydrolase